MAAREPPRDIGDDEGDDESDDDDEEGAVNDRMLLSLSSILGVNVSTDTQALATVQQDFGRMCRGGAEVVVRPASVDELRAVVAWANRYGASLTPRGKGMSQSGQSVATSGCAVDLSAFDAVVVDHASRTVRCGSAATWREIVAKTAERGLIPSVMPLNLDLSVGGTISAGGFGSTSHHRGLVVSSVVACEVITGAGDVVRCTPTDRDDVWGAVLGGLGHFGFIVEATLSLRELAPRARTFTLLYDDLERYLGDQRLLMEQPWAHHLDGFCSPAVLGLRRGAAARRVPFARWFYALHVTVEHEPDAEPTAAMLAGLNHRELLLVDDDDALAFAARFDARFDAMRLTGDWQSVHPWVEFLLPYAAAIEVIPRVLDALPLFLGGGHRASLVAAAARPDLLMFPSGEPTVAFAILPVAVPEPLRQYATSALRAAHETMLDAGGKRYLSGWLFEPNSSEWKRHFQDRYDLWQARKRALDPAGIFSSCLLPGPDER